MVKIMTHLHMQRYESLCNNKYLYMLNYLLCADMHICTWCLNHKQKYKIELVSQTEKYQKSPQYVFTIKGTTDSIFFFFFGMPTHSDFVVYTLTVRVDLTSCLCKSFRSALVEQAGGDFPQLRE